MKGQELFKRLRGAIGNAAVWGAGWSAATLAVFGVMFVSGHANASDWHEAWQMAARLGVVGGLAGGAFSAVIGLLYRGRNLADISWIRFGIRGGAVAGVFVPAMMLVGRTISGDGPLAIGNYIASAITAAAFGAVAAGVTMKLAQRSASPDDENDDPQSEYVRPHVDGASQEDNLIDRQGGDDVAALSLRPASRIRPNS